MLTTKVNMEPMDNEKQKDEIIALESIYNEEEFSHHEEDGHYQCTLKIFINLPEEYYFTYKDTRSPEVPGEKVRISHLPPLSLYITLPQDYPSKSRPNFTLSSSWLKQIATAKLCKRLDKIWEENVGQEILFSWVAFLQDETLEFLGIQNGLDISHIYTFYKMSTEKAQSIKSLENSDNTEKKTTKEDAKNANRVHKRHWKKSKYSIDKRAVFDCPSDTNPVQMLIDYNDKRNQIEFKKNFYTCNICFTNKIGENCTKFSPCSHVFCKDCISGYLEVRIKEGDVQNILCPEEKCTSEATPGQIKDLLSPELFAKYDSILLSATLDTMVDIVYCPRRHCQYPVSCEANEQMASCPACQYTFCIYCKMVYHGIEPCKVNSAEKQQLVSEYQAASEEKKIEMETRYGKKRLQGLVENAMSENWINDNSHNCPKCHTAIEKSDGCNKMTCGRCKTFFCWLCSAKLNPDAPYVHFQNPQSTCFNMLYHGMINDEDEDDDDIDFPAVYLGYDSEDEDFYDDDFVIEFDI